jgi:hypothetical protein
MDCVGLRNRLVDARLTVDLVGRVIVRRAAGTHFVKMVQVPSGTDATGYAILCGFR